LHDDAVCIGDRYRIGSALFEVTQPRVTCYRVGIRMNEPRMPELLTSSGRPGFYFRVLELRHSREMTLLCSRSLTQAARLRRG
jgi:MOSC domain-containing protein YiiM